MINETGGGLWIRELNEDSQDSFHELSNFKPEQAEIERLVCEVAKLKMERDIQKKTASHQAPAGSLYHPCGISRTSVLNRLMQPLNKVRQRPQIALFFCLLDKWRLYMLRQ